MAYSEDDTFRYLSRPNLDDLIYILNELSDLESRAVLVNETTRRQFLSKHGWTLEEYQQALSRRRNGVI